MTDTNRSVSPSIWQLRTRSLTLDRTRLMGVLNVTPDSFSDGGSYSNIDEAVAAGLAMVEDGADIVDVGGESTRPGAEPVGLAHELERTIPVVSALSAEGVIVSIDTMKPGVAAAAIEAGAEIINDVSGFRSNDMVRVAASTGTAVVVMHMLGDPRTMQDEPAYDDVVTDIVRYLEVQAARLQRTGVPFDRIAVDPGIGFGKAVDHNLEILRHAGRFSGPGYPVVIGPSRKRFLGTITGVAVAADRDAATAAAASLGVATGASIVRAHNVAVVGEALQVADAIVRATWQSRD